MDKHDLLVDILQKIRNMDGAYDYLLLEPSLSVEEKIGIICESVIDDMTSYLMALEMAE